MAFTIKIERCEDCPNRRDRESHGPCDSSNWVECKLTGLVIDGQDAGFESVKWKYKKGSYWERDPKAKFPPFCPLVKKKKAK